MLALLLGLLLGLLLLGFPMLVPLLAASLAVLLVFFPALEPSLLVQQMVGGVRPVVLTAVPMFIFSADLMTKGRSADRLLDLVLRCVGHVRGGLPIATAVGCTLFGAVSGSTQATVVAIGGAMRPRLLARGYRDSFALALIVSASDVALLIPPSIGMIVYGVVSGTSVGELFIAGIGPGLLILAVFSAYCRLAARWQGVEPLARADAAARWRARSRISKGRPRREDAGAPRRGEPRPPSTTSPGPPGPRTERARGSTPGACRRRPARASRRPA